MSCRYFYLVSISTYVTVRNWIRYFYPIDSYILFYHVFVDYASDTKGYCSKTLYFYVGAGEPKYILETKFYVGMLDYDKSCLDSTFIDSSGAWILTCSTLSPITLPIESNT